MASSSRKHFDQPLGACCPARAPPPGSAPRVPRLGAPLRAGAATASAGTTTAPWRSACTISPDRTRMPSTSISPPNSTSMRVRVRRSDAAGQKLESGRPLIDVAHRAVGDEPERTQPAVDGRLHLAPERAVACIGAVEILDQHERWLAAGVDVAIVVVAKLEQLFGAEASARLRARILAVRAKPTTGRIAGKPQCAGSRRVAMRPRRRRARPRARCRWSAYRMPPARRWRRSRARRAHLQVSFSVAQAPSRSGTMPAAATA